MIFKEVRDGRPYPDHTLSTRDWAKIPPRQVRLDQLVTTKRELALDKLLDEDSTFYGDLFPHAVQWRGELYLEDGLHRALRAALQQRHVLHVRVLNLDELAPEQPDDTPQATDGRNTSEGSTRSEGSTQPRRPGDTGGQSPVPEEPTGTG